MNYKPQEKSVKTDYAEKYKQKGIYPFGLPMGKPSREGRTIKKKWKRGQK